jgi:hypothetical protein
MPQSVMRKRIEQLVDHADSDEWSLTKSYPNILLVCEIDRIQKSVQRWVTQESYRGWSNDLAINVVALDANKWEL